MMNNARRRFISLPLLALLFVFVCNSEALAAWRAAGNVTSVVKRHDGATLTLSSGARVSVTFLTPDVVRVRLAPRGVFEPDVSYAVEPKKRDGVATVVRETRDAVMMSPAGNAVISEVVIQRRPFLVTVLDAQGRTIARDDPRRQTMFDTESGAIETSKTRDQLELYYGFGEKALPQARHGRTMVMWNFDTYAYPPGLDPIYQSIPFFVALRQGLAHGIFFDNTRRTFFDMGQTDPARYTFGAAGGELNYYVFTGGRERTPKNVLRDYTDLTGRTPLPPMWALGYQQSRYSYETDKRVREIAKNFRDRRIPADVLYFDIDYMDGFRVFTWHKENFKEPQKLLKDLSADGFHSVVIIDPGIKVDENYSVYREGRDKKFFHQTARGEEFRARVWPGICAFPDFTNPLAREWFGSLYKKNLDEGVAGFWNDMNEPGVFAEDTRPPQPQIFHDPASTFPLTVRHAGDGLAGDHARYHNVYGMQMARATFEGLRKLRPDERPFVLTRAGYAGIQRYSAVWTGDNISTWEHLQLTIPMLTGMGVSGIPFVGADVGGYTGGPSAELYARWLQAASLTPFFRSHVGKGAPDQEPWVYGDDFEKINRATIELRYKLLPYIYTLFREHEETGAPVMRPLWFEYPQDFATYNPAPQSEQFLLGRDLMVAPVLTQGATKRGVYFPKGDAWVNWWTGERHEGGTFATVDAPLERLPLFARVGANIPTQDVIQHTGDRMKTPLDLTVVPGADSRTVIYQDRGDGYGRESLKSFAVTVEQKAGVVGVSQLTSMNYTLDSPSWARVRAVELLGFKERPKNVLLDERPAEGVDFDRAARRLRIKAPQVAGYSIRVEP